MINNILDNLKNKFIKIYLYKINYIHLILLNYYIKK